MSSPLHAAYYADQALQRTVAVIENERIARGTYRLRMQCPEIAQRIVPGQFLMIRLSGIDDPLIGRPLALYDTVALSGDVPTAIDVVYIVKGKFTRLLATLPPAHLVDIWGPLGNGFAPDPADHLLMVAGGIGQTPFLAVAQEFLGRRRYGQPPREVPTARRVTLCYGARSADLLAGVEDFQRIGVEVELCTDDGTFGHHGLVTDLLQQVLERTSSDDQRIVCCGPEAMMRAVADLAEQRGVGCQVSLETPMACGIGICFTCVARVRDAGGGWDYKRTCVEGPVFDARLIEW